MIGIYETSKAERAEAGVGLIGTNTLFIDMISETNFFPALNIFRLDKYKKGKRKPGNIFEPRKTFLRIGKYF